MEEREYKKGHGGLAILLAILGLLVGTLGTIGFGKIVFFVGIGLAVLGIILGIVSRVQTGRKGLGGIIWGIIAILLSVGSFMFLNGMSGIMKDHKDKLPITGELFEELPAKGLIGFSQALVDSGHTQEEITKEFEDAAKMIGDSSSNN